MSVSPPDLNGLVLLLASRVYEREMARYESHADGLGDVPIPAHGHCAMFHNTRNERRATPGTIS